jgi:hypothetical protein
MSDVEFIAKCILLILYISLFVFCFSRSRLFSIYTFLFVYHVGVLASIVLIDHFDFNSLIFVGNKNNAFYLFYLFALVSMAFVFLITRNHDRWVMGLPRKAAGLFYVAILIMALPLLIARFKGAEIDRFDAYASLPFPWLFSVLSVLISGLFVFALLSARDDRERMLACAAMMMSNYSVGAEFGSFIEVLLWLFVSKRVCSGSIPKAYYLAGALVAIGAIAYKISSLSTTDVTFLGRFAMQGEMFYSLLNTRFPDGFVDADALAKYASTFFSVETYRTNADYGFGRLMVELAGSTAYLAIDENVRFTAGYPATVMYHSNYAVAMILNIVFLYIYVKIFVRLFFQILRRHGALLFALYFKVFIIVGWEFLMMGDYGQIKFKLLALLFLILAYMLASELWAPSKSTIPERGKALATPQHVL